MWYVLLVALFSIVTAIQVAMEEPVQSEEDIDLDSIFNESHISDSDSQFQGGDYTWHDGIDLDESQAWHDGINLNETLSQGIVADLDELIQQATLADLDELVQQATLADLDELVQQAPLDIQDIINTSITITPEQNLSDIQVEPLLH